MQWRGGAATWPEVLGRIALMAVASVAFSAVMFSLIERMNAAIRSERRRLEAMFQSSSEAVLLVDHNRAITALNPAAEAMLGYPARPDGLHLCRLCVPTEEGAPCPAGCPLNLGQPRPFFESVVRHRDGSLLPVAVSTSSLPASEEGHPESMLTLVDMSRHREKEHARLSSMLTQRTMEAQEEERRRLARELHDGVAQELYGLKLAARMGTPVEDKISEIMDGVGRLAKSLWPPVLEKLGLVQALRTHLDSLGPNLVLEAPDTFPRLGMPVEATLYRIAQEAVGNSLRHGHPGRLTVRLSERAGEVRMEIEDDGSGFDPAALTVEGLGLVGMRERAQGLGGTLAVRSERGRGTLVTVLVPREVKAVV